MDLFHTTLEAFSHTQAGRSIPSEGVGPSPRETYRIDERRNRIVRTVYAARRPIETTVEILGGAPLDDPHSAFDWCWLRQNEAPRPRDDERPVRIADMFAGCAQMSLGASEACRALGRRGDVVFAIDSYPAAADMCQRAHPRAVVRREQVERLLGGVLYKPFSLRELGIRREVGEVDLLLGGPPCQGHSNLNNKSRRHDERNALGFRMVRAAHLFQPRHVVIENVLGIKNDVGHVFSKMKNGLVKLGYRVAEAVVRAEEFGVAQRRHRRFLVGTRIAGVDPDRALASVGTVRRSFEWACGDLEDVSDSFMNRHPVPKPQNQRRIAYLFRHGIHDLPSSQRPECHRNGTAYTSSYGRIYTGQPVQTITTSFQCIGTGRFIHPTRPRPITLREAARLQSIPDFVDFEGLNSTTAAQLIGNAVPPKVLYSIALRLLWDDPELQAPTSHYNGSSGRQRRPL